MWRTQLLLMVFTAGSQLNQIQCHTADSYIGAVVEYASPLLPNVSPDEVMKINADVYRKYITEAASNKVDIIVFPEEGLQGRNQKKSVTIPAPADRISPCDFNSSYHSAVVLLSCAARASNIYLVINLSEEYFNSTFNRTEHYNTNVAFDRNGTVIGRYRKFNPYGEPVTKPASPDHHIFKTDFGVSFGMFICFDLDFLEPAIVLARDYGVKHFVFSHCWISELPFLTAMQAQWGWAYSLDVVLLASGCNDPSKGGTGSGIYQGRRGELQAFQTNALTSKMLIANISTSFDCDDENGDPLIVIDGKPEGENISLVKLRDTTDVLQDYHKDSMSNSSVSLHQGSGVTILKEPKAESNSSLVMLRDYLDVYKSHPLLPIRQDHTQVDKGNLTVYFTTETTLCHNNFCCDFKVEMTMMFSEESPKDSRRGDDFSDQLYRLVVFDGVRWYGGGLATGGIQVCGIVACVNDSISSCGLRADDSSRQTRVYGNLFQIGTVFQRISLTPKFLYNSTFVYPDILLTGTGNDFGKLMPSSDFTFEEFGPYNNSILYSLTIDVPVPNLVTAAVYARQFDRDGQKRTEISNGHDSYSYNSVIIVCVLFVFILIH